MKNKSCLIIVDYQNDFIFGSLKIDDADSLVTKINDYINSKDFDYIVASKDMHPKNHKSFVTNGGIWPPHCVQNTSGSEYHKDLNADKIDYCINKGTNPKYESYSAFQDEVGNKSDLEQWLDERHITKLYFCGLALDYCVGESIKDALKLNKYEIYLFKDGVKSIGVQDEILKALDSKIIVL